jgi:deoxyhypusine monooxygenase
MQDPKATILDLTVSKDARIQAAFHLENIADEASIKAMAQCLFTDPSPIVRHEAAFALGETAAPKLAGPHLMKAIEEDSSVFVAHEALMALGTLGDTSFIPFIKKFLPSDDPDIAESAEIALQRLEMNH